jgi:ribulose-5-phosphate 4-epimerase/fuculose-1-phosphate aldolase
MTDSIEEVKKELLACARRAYAIGLQTGNGGNLSARPFPGNQNPSGHLPAKT